MHRHHHHLHAPHTLIKPVALAAILTAHALLTDVAAQDGGTRPNWAAYSMLETVVVTGARSERTLESTPAAVDVLQGEDLDPARVQDIRDLVRDLPNVSVRRAPQRFGPAIGSTGRDGNAGFNIRGLEGNRVLLTVDGVRIPRSLSGGLFGNAAFGRDYYDMGLVSKVEIVRGASSALYGSDGLAGMVAMTTISPQDLLGPGQALGARMGVALDSENQGWNAGVMLAGQLSESVQWLGSVRTGRSQALDNQGRVGGLGASRTEPNPQRDRDDSFMGKLVLTPSADQQHTLTLLQVNKESRVDAQSAESVVGLGWRTDDLLGTSATEKQRLSWQSRWTVEHQMADEVRFTLAHQRANANERSVESRTRVAIVGAPTPPVGSRQERIRDISYDEQLWQAVLQAEKTQAVGPNWAHTWVYGIEWTQTDLSNLLTGTIPPAGESFPLKRFPDTTETTWGAFLQSEWVSDRWSIIPAVRLDRFKIQPEADPLFRAASSSLSDSAISPKLGVIFRPTQTASIFGNVAAGFRAPSAHEINSGFENPISTGGRNPYRTIPNPHLKPETSRTLELGARGQANRVEWEVVAFAGRYRNFISDNPEFLRTEGGTDILQFINRDRVQLSGLELKSRWQVAPRTWLRASYGYTQGKDSTTQRPINSVNPAELSLGIDHRHGAWSVGATLTHTARKSPADIDFTPLPTQFATPSYTTLDLSASWQLRPGLRWSAAVRNLTNETYWEWGNVRGVPTASPGRDAFSAPGRSLAVAITADF
jgi:hemoglobin/transferrin/lactoferrin receptor protein